MLRFGSEKLEKDRLDGRTVLLSLDNTSPHLIHLTLSATEQLGFAQRCIKSFGFSCYNTHNSFEALLISSTCGFLASNRHIHDCHEYFRAMSGLHAT